MAVARFRIEIAGRKPGLPPANPSFPSTDDRSRPRSLVSHNLRPLATTATVISPLAPSVPKITIPYSALIDAHRIWRSCRALMLLA
ncbi:hypothetical protein BOTBODRAFT_213252 [Botryobasidium botryosum FD-172 SS1]|uniref:Uncharacterized protein n=1 Tax=Botryobasidium botryosum (strain FD-172 SS1) TaxID=930990 RepID=A0A067N1Q3_BOTB1|nr:hypothetical protein BOTBODRAFT_213252 [Botryobasidium botryosum FD-172 SS1]